MRLEEINSKQTSVLRMNTNKRERGREREGARGGRKGYFYLQNTLISHKDWLVTFT